VLAVVDCALEAEHPAGDHSIVLGRVRDVRVATESEPLVYFAGGFGAFRPTEKEHPCP
jgi:3-hydroxy-9,10-secoandrosta-1,3,5(10)-triene-9,17-dione monooxygenase reductase component